MVMFKFYLLTGFTVILLFLTGCSFIGALEELACPFFSGSTEAHCFKDSASRQEDPVVCSKIQDLSDVGNAPRNQCYQDIAMSTKNVTMCANIQNPGFVSTTKEGCEAAVGRVGGGKVDIQPSPAQGKCKYDADCPMVCEGSTLWKQGCKDDGCVKIFDYPCTSEVIADISFMQLCSVQEQKCVRDARLIQQKRDELRDQYNQFSRDMQSMTQLQLTSSRNCLAALSDVTNQFIIESATMMGGIMAGGLPTLAQIGADATVKTIEKLTEADMSSEEFIAFHCSLDKQLTTDIRKTDLKRKMLMEQVEELNQAASSS